MKYIAHRGNLNGPNRLLENKPDYLNVALSLGYDVEVDVWFIDGKFFLGHDRPDYEIDIQKQKDLSSVSILEISFPKIVYMIVNNKIELEIKTLKDFPEWDFLSPDDLNRKTLQIYFDIKIAKRDCGKEQRVIKVPNPEVFRIVAPLLASRGISRIVSDDNLIAL